MRNNSTAGGSASGLNHCRDSGASGYGGTQGGSRREANNHTTCPACGKRVRITQDGRLWAHGTRRPATLTPWAFTQPSTSGLGFQVDDGGRALAGYQGKTGDCVTRAIAIAAEMSYQAAYDLVNQQAERERPELSKRRKGRSSARTGVYKPTIRRIMEHLGWTWHPTMKIGQGCTVHLKAGELPGGRLLVAVSKHLVAVIDGVIHDTHDPSRDGTRCVYGYFTPPVV